LLPAKADDFAAANALERLAVSYDRPGLVAVAREGLECRAAFERQMKDAILGDGSHEAFVQKLKNDSRLVSIHERVHLTSLPAVSKVASMMSTNASGDPSAMSKTSPIGPHTQICSTDLPTRNSNGSTVISITVAPAAQGSFRNTDPGERLGLGVGCPFSGSPRRYVVYGAASLDDHVDCVVVRPDPDHVAVRVDDCADRRRLRGEHRDAGG
jgi:hypothetical protein